jgi:GNAT superfamily N-acetyltransferase
MEYSLRNSTPTVEIYCQLRRACGLSPMPEAAAQAGLPNSVYAVQVFCGDQPVGMGRIIGDGGCFYQIVDMAVLPEHQGRGLGKRIMAALVSHLEASAVKGAYVSLIADGRAHELYAQFGFNPTAPKSIGMARFI